MEKNKINNHKIVLVTGASSRLGKNIVEHLASERYIVYAGFNSSKLQIDSKQVHPIRLNIADSKSIKRAIQNIIKIERKIDILVNCAGVTKVGKFVNSNLDELDLLLNINVKGQYRIIKEVLPVMTKQNSGKIVNITSMSGLISLPYFSIYSASKFAFEALTTALRYEVQPNNIWVTNIEPGAIKSEASNDIKMPHKTFREKFLPARLLLPLVEGSEISKQICQLVESPRPPANILVGRDVKMVSFLKKFLPSFVWDRILRYIYHE